MKWISVNEKLPAIYDFVLVCANNQGTNEPKPVTIARLDSQGFWDFLDTNDTWTYGAYSDISYVIDRDDITHWMPLPYGPSD